MSVVSPARHSGLNNQVRGDTPQWILLTSYPSYQLISDFFLTRGEGGFQISDFQTTQHTIPCLVKNMSTLITHQNFGISKSSHYIIK